MFNVVASHIKTGMIWLIECPWEMEHSPVLWLSALYLLPFSEWCELQKEAKFHRDSCKDIPDAVNSLVSDRPLNIHSFQEISSWHEPTGMYLASITCLYCAHCDWSLSVSSKKWEIVAHQNLVGVKNQMLTVSSPDLSEMGAYNL